MKYYRIREADDTFDRPAGEIVYQNQKTLKELQEHVVHLVGLMNNLSSDFETHIDLTRSSNEPIYPHAARTIWQQSGFSSNTSSPNIINSVSSPPRIASQIVEAAQETNPLTTTLQQTRRTRERVLTADDRTVELPAKFHTIEECIDYWHYGNNRLNVKPLKLWSKTARNFTSSIKSRYAQVKTIAWFCNKFKINKSMAI